MIIRIRSALGTARLEVEPDERVANIRTKVVQVWPDLVAAESSLSLRRSDRREDLLRNAAVGGTFEDLELRHGDLLYLDFEVAESRATAYAATETALVNKQSQPQPTRYGSHAVMFRWLHRIATTLGGG